MALGAWIPLFAQRPARTIGPTAIASAEAFGADQINRAIAPTGIVSAEAFGSLSISRLIALAGISSAGAFGADSISRLISLTAIASAGAFGTTTVSLAAVAGMVIGQCKVDPLTGASGRDYTAIKLDADNGLAPGALVNGDPMRKLMGALIAACTKGIIQEIQADGAVSVSVSAGGLQTSTIAGTATNPPATTQTLTGAVT